MKGMTVAVDIDEVVCQLHERWLALYRADWNDNLTPEDLTHWDIEKQVHPDCGLSVFNYLHRKDLYEEVKPVEGSLEGVRALREMGHRVVFATSAHIKHGGVKFDWLSINGYFDGVEAPHKDYLEVRDKSLVAADILIDDYDQNLIGFKGERILFKRPHNRNVGWLTLVANGWPDVIEIVKEIEYCRAIWFT